MKRVSHDWIEDVLVDLAEFASSNELPLTALAMLTARDELRVETEKSKVEGPSVFPSAPALWVVPQS